MRSLLPDPQRAYNTTTAISHRINRAVGARHSKTLRPETKLTLALAPTILRFTQLKTPAIARESCNGCKINISSPFAPVNS